MQGSANIRSGNLVLVGVVLAVLSFNFTNLALSLLHTGSERFPAPTISPEMIGALVLVLAAAMIGTFRRSLVLSYASVPTLGMLLFAGLALCVSVGVHGDMRSVITFVGMGAVFLAGRLIFKRYSYFLTENLQYGLHWFPLVLFVFMGMFLLLGRLDYQAGFFKPQIVGGIRSTEVSLVLGLQVIYLTYALEVAHEFRRRIRYLLIMALAWLMLIWLLSLGTIAALMVVILGRYLLKSWATRTIRIRNILLASLLVLAVVPLVAELFTSDLSMNAAWAGAEHGRAEIWPELVYLARENSYTGIGLGEYVKAGQTRTHPHNNFLGLAAELGVPVAVAYLVFVLSVVWFAFHEIRRSSFTRIRSALPLLAFSAFLYLQIKGLVQDTWQLKENYFWAGALLGSVEGFKRTYGFKAFA